MSRWTMLLIGLVATLALLAAACGTTEEEEEDTPADPPTPTATAAVITGSAADTPESEPPMMDDVSVSGIPLDPDAKLGGILRTPYTSNSPSFVPWESAAGHAFPVGHLMNNMLIKSRTWGSEEDFNSHAYFQLEPDLATDWEQSDDGKAYTFTLRDGVNWSDGVPVTCNDIKWSFDTIRLGSDAGLPTSPRKTHYLAVDSIACPDDLTVVFNLRWAKPAMIEVIGQPYNVIFPAHIYQQEYLDTGALQSFREAPSEASTGAFTLQEWIPGESFTFERNDDYWDAPLPYLDGVEIQFLASANVPVALRGGQLDIGNAAGYTGGQAETLLQECTEICQFWDQRVIASSFSPALFINKEREGWMSDQRVHEAFALAIDNQKYVTTVRNDWYELPVGCGFYPTSPWAMPRERCGQIVGFADVVPETVEGRKAAALADKEKARALLAEAGYTEDNPLEVRWTVWSPIQVDVPAFQSDLEEVGVKVTPDIQESATAYGNWATANFDFGVHSFWIAGIDPDVTLYEHFYTGSDRNYNRYSNPEFDNLVNQMSRTLDEQERKELAWDAMEMALNDVAKIVVSHSSYISAVNKDVRGFMPALNYLAFYGPQGRYSHVWLDR